MEIGAQATMTRIIISGDMKRFRVDRSRVPSLFEPTQYTAEMRAVVADDPRPGVWVQDAPGSNQPTQSVGDRRALTQAETDALIRAELAAVARADEREEVIRIVGEPEAQHLLRPAMECVYAIQQRGGIDSDPLIRLLAYRAWGDRDRRWFEHNGDCDPGWFERWGDRNPGWLWGVRKGEAVTLVTRCGDVFGPKIAYTRGGEEVLGIAGHDAYPGADIDVKCPFTGRHLICCYSEAFRVSDRLRALPER